MGKGSSKPQDPAAGKAADKNKSAGGGTAETRKELKQAREAYLAKLTDQTLRQKKYNQVANTPVYFANELIEKRRLLYVEYDKENDEKMDKLADSIAGVMLGEKPNTDEKENENSPNLRSDIFMAEYNLLQEINSVLDDWKEKDSVFKKIPEVSFGSSIIDNYATVDRYVWRVLGELFHNSYVLSEQLLIKIDASRLFIKNRILVLNQVDRRDPEKYDKYLKGLKPGSSTKLIFDRVDSTLDEIEEFLEKLNFCLNVVNAYIHFSCTAVFQSQSAISAYLSEKEPQPQAVKIKALYENLKDLISFILHALKSKFESIEEFEKNSSEGLLTCISTVLDITGENKAAHLEYIGTFKGRIVTLRRTLMGILQEVKDSTLTSLKNDIEDLGAGFYGLKPPEPKKAGPPVHVACSNPDRRRGLALQRQRHQPAARRDPILARQDFLLQPSQDRARTGHQHETGSRRDQPRAVELAAAAEDAHAHLPDPRRQQGQPDLQLRVQRRQRQHRGAHKLHRKEDVERRRRGCLAARGTSQCLQTPILSSCEPAAELPARASTHKNRI